MPRGTGVFIRTNGQYNGQEVWQDDLENNIKIIALRHDTHDQDLAVGIAECLPKTGLEPMLGNLQMGGFLIKNLANGLLAADGANYGQVINSAIFDEPTRTLTLGRAGLPPLAVTIQSGGDNTVITTGVQELTIGSGLNLTGASLGGNVMNEGNPQGTIELATINGVAGSFTNPNLTVDSKGRITSITGGGSTLTNLSTTYFTNAVRINPVTGSTAGTSATINAVGTLTAGVMSTGSQSFRGQKEFQEQMFASDGITCTGGMRLLVLPTTPTQSGALYSEGGFVKITP